MRSVTLVAVLCAFVAAPAVADLSWQTTPILGTDWSDTTGDVVMITGPTPEQPAGGYYYDVDGNLVLGPTIPHYSIAGDPLYQVGSPSMTQFSINPTVWDGAHWYDPDVFVYSGSGVNLDPAMTYHYTGVYTYLGPNSSYSVLAAEDTDFSEESGFVMLVTGVGQFWLEDIGNWQYIETWTENGTGLSISATTDFAVVPVPAAVLLGMLGLGVAGVKLRKHV